MDEIKSDEARAPDAWQRHARVVATKYGADLWGLSSAGRAPALQAGGHRFDPVSLHHFSGQKTEYRRQVAVLSGLSSVL